MNLQWKVNTRFFNLIFFCIFLFFFFYCFISPLLFCCCWFVLYWLLNIFTLFLLNSLATLIIRIEWLISRNVEWMELNWMVVWLPNATIWFIRRCLVHRRWRTEYPIPSSTFREIEKHNKSNVEWRKIVSRQYDLIANRT